MIRGKHLQNLGKKQTFRIQETGKIFTEQKISSTSKCNHHFYYKNIGEKIDIQNMYKRDSAEECAFSLCLVYCDVCACVYDGDDVYSCVYANDVLCPSRPSSVSAKRKFI